MRLLRLGWAAWTNPFTIGPPVPDVAPDPTGPASAGPDPAAKGTGHRERAPRREIRERNPELLAALREAWDLWGEGGSTESLARADELLPDVFASQDVRVWELTGHLLLRQSRPELVVEHLPRAVERLGKTPDLCLALGRAQINLRNREEADRWLREAIELEPGASRHHWARARLRIVFGDVEGSLEAALQAFSLDGDVATLRRLLRKQQIDGLSLDVLARAIDESGLSPERARAVERTFDRVQSLDSRQDELLREDLTQMVLMAAERGVQPVLLSYAHPGIQASAGPATYVVADLLSVPLVDLTATFRALLRDEPESAYFVADLHPNDDGYQVMAEEVRDRLLAFESRRTADRSPADAPPSGSVPAP